MLDKQTFRSPWTLDFRFSLHPYYLEKLGEGRGTLIWLALSMGTNLGKGAITMWALIRGNALYCLEEITELQSI